MTEFLPVAPVSTPWETPDSSAPGAPTPAPTVDAAPPNSSALTRRPIWQSILATLLVIAFLAWAGYQCWIAGLAVRDRTWQTTTTIRFNVDIANALNQGNAALAAGRDVANQHDRKIPLTVWQSVMGMQRLYDNLLKRTSDADNGNFGLDYPPGRLFIATLWARWVQIHYPLPNGNAPVWSVAKEDMATPMLWCNTIAAAIASVAMFLLVWVWVRREGSSHSEPGLSIHQAVADLVMWISALPSRLAALFSETPAADPQPSGISALRPAPPLANVPIIGPWLYRPVLPPQPLEIQPWWPCNGALAAIASGFGLAWCGKVAFQGDQWPSGAHLLFMGLLLVILIISVRQLPRAHKAWACGLVAALFIWFDPAVLAVSHVWPQWDVWSVPFFLISALLASIDWWLCAGIVLAVGVMFKGQLLLPGPVLILWPLLGGRIGPSLRILSGFIFGGAMVLSPFLVSQVPQMQWIAMAAVGAIVTAKLILSVRFHQWGWLTILWQQIISSSAIAVGIAAMFAPHWIPIEGIDLVSFRVLASAAIVLGVLSLFVRHFVVGLVAIAAGIAAWFAPRYIPITGDDLTLFRVLASAIILLAAMSLVFRYLTASLVALVVGTLAWLVERRMPITGNDFILFRILALTVIFLGIESVIVRYLTASVVAIVVGIVAWLAPHWVPIFGIDLTLLRIYASLTVLLGLASIIIRYVLAVGRLRPPPAASAPDPARANFVALNARAAGLLDDATVNPTAPLAARVEPALQTLFAPPAASRVEPPAAASNAPTGGLTRFILSALLISAVLGWTVCFVHYLFPTLPALVIHNHDGTAWLTITGRNVTAIAQGALVLMLIAIPWLLPRRGLIPWFFMTFGVMVWISSFGQAAPGATQSGLNGDFGWYHVGFEYGTYKFPVMQMGGNTFSNLTSILSVRYGWQIGDIVFNLDSMHHAVTMKELLVSIYLLGLLLSALGAAIHSRKNDPRVLIALAAPWVLFPIVLTQMSERYLLMSSCISAAVIAASTELTLLHIVIALVGGAMALQQAMTHYGQTSAGSYMPSVSWLLTNAHPDIGFLTTAIAAVFLCSALIPKRRRPRSWPRSNRPEPKNNLLSKSSLA